METSTASGKIIREPVVIVFCCGCGAQLALDARYDGRRIVTNDISWPHDMTGVYCARCRPLEITGTFLDSGYNASKKETAILDALDGHPDGLTVMELADEIGLPRTTIYRRLETLERRGDVRRDSGKFFLSQN